jgi:hypothetical protein
LHDIGGNRQPNRELEILSPDFEVSDEPNLEIEEIQEQNKPLESALRNKRAEIE